MIRAQYIRFKKDISPMSPGRGGTEITKAYVPSNTGVVMTVASHEVMDEILVGEAWVTLVKKVRSSDGKPYVARRVIPRDSVRDYEPLIEKEKVPA